ncbi:MAG: hypothetical protein IKZ04_06440 [Spirochaetaceae bacterium]|nr:hypothetical protein [Spirochaetaceae bacterium]
MRNISLFILFSIFCFQFGFAQTSVSISFPDSYYTFRDNMYNAIGKTPAEYETQYNAVLKEIGETKSGLEKTILDTHCDYVLARAYRYVGLKDKAIQYFDKTIEKCKNILQNHEIPQVYVLYADSISQNCALKPKSYAISQGPKIKTMAKKALDLDPTYGTAYFLTNTQNIFTPPPFGNLEEGMKALIPLLDKNIYRMDKADYYNAFTARGFGYLEKGDKEQAEYWYKKGLEIYPLNPAAHEMLEVIKKR